MTILVIIWVIYTEKYLYQPFYKTKMKILSHKMIKFWGRKNILTSNFWNGKSLQHWYILNFWIINPLFFKISDQSYLTAVHYVILDFSKKLQIDCFYSERRTLISAVMTVNPLNRIVNFGLTKQAVKFTKQAFCHCD